MVNYDDLFEEVSEEEARKAARVDPEYKVYLESLRSVVGTEAGARVICEVLERTGVFEPVWSEKNAKLIHRAVLNDFGKAILDDLALASAAAHDDIQRMMRVRRKLDNALRT